MDGTVPRISTYHCCRRPRSSRASNGAPAAKCSGRPSPCQLFRKDPSTTTSPIACSVTWPDPRSRNRISRPTCSCCHCTGPAFGRRDRSNGNSGCHLSSLNDAWANTESQTKVREWPVVGPHVTLQSAHGRTKVSVSEASPRSGKRKHRATIT